MSASRLRTLLMYGASALLLAYMLLPLVFIVPMSLTSGNTLAFPTPGWCAGGSWGGLPRGRWPGPPMARWRRRSGCSWFGSWRRSPMATRFPFRGRSACFPGYSRGARWGS